MRKIIYMMLLFLPLLYPGSGVCRMSNTEIESNLMKLFEYARVHNVNALKGLQLTVRDLNNKTLNNAYPLALYIASPNQYEKEFVEKFPVDHEGIMNDLYERIELRRLTPKFLYSFESIGIIADHGNQKALQKVLLGYIHSDGVVAEMYCDSLVRIFLKSPNRVLPFLSVMGMNERKKIYLCFNTLNSTNFQSLKENIRKIAPELSPGERIVIEEIENYHN